MELLELEQHLQQHILYDNSEIYSDVPDAYHPGIAVYHDAYWLRLIDILGREYPTLAYLLGEPVFKQWCRTYLTEHPSQATSVHEIGALFPISVFEHEPQKVYLHECAQFEWTLVMAQRMIDPPLLTIEHLGAIVPEDWATQKFNIHPSVQLLTQHHNILDVWRAVVFPEEYQVIPEVHALNQPAQVMVWYHAPQAFYETIDSKASQLLQRFREGNTFGECCEWAAEIDGTSDEEVAQWIIQHMVRWTQQGIFIRE